jgi:aromatic-L-amino-acid/L-tryptophan decarboxylase
MHSDPPSAEETLDPPDWNDLKRLGHQMVDEMMDYLSTVRQRPAWRSVPTDVRERLRAPLPEEPQGMASAYADFVENVLPYPTGNIHPRFWGWVKGTGSAEGMLAEMLAAGMNCNVSGFDDAATLVEHQVLDWCKQMLGYPAAASGILVSGGSMANLVGLAVARQARAGFDVRAEGLGAAPRRLVLYASSETHLSVQKAVELLGLGRSALRLIEVNERFEIDISALAAAITADRAAGQRPFCVVGHVGTVNTGAVDDIEGLAALSEHEGLWLHVDGAFGAWAALAESHRSRLAALARADSLAFDLHKWLYVPYEVGCTLVRSDVAHASAFALSAAYLDTNARGAAAGDVRFGDYGVQLSRGFRALKVWMTLKAFGRRKLARLIEQNLAQAAHLARLVDAHPDLERLAPVALNVVCFRFCGGASKGETLNALNREILIRLHEEGVAVPSSTTLAGRFALRVAITNHRTRREDLETLIDAVVRLGRTLP